MCVSGSPTTHSPGLDFTPKGACAAVLFTDGAASVDVATIAVVGTVAETLEIRLGAIVDECRMKIFLAM